MDENNLRKQLNDIIRCSHNNSKLDHCLCCGKEVSSFCNSHSLPRFILNNISKNGMVLTSNKYLKMPLISDLKGLNNSGTFKRICAKCDKELFKNYEDEKLMTELPRKKIMTQIDLKNTLRMYDKRLNEIALYEELMTMNPDEFMLREIMERQYINRLDLKEIIDELNKDIDILSKKSSSSFNLIYWNILDYVTPIAFQGHIALYGDLDGNIINDLYNHNSNYIIENINVCVFPLKSQTVVMMFVNNDNKKYRDFIKQFKKLKESNKLKLISFIIFNYSEDFFVSQLANKKMLENPILDIVTQNVTDVLALDVEMAKDFKKLKKFELMNYENFPNILDEEFSINKITI